MQIVQLVVEYNSTGKMVYCNDYWMPSGRDGEDMAVEQLVLPKECYDRVISLAHSIPLACHLG